MILHTYSVLPDKPLESLASAIPAGASDFAWLQSLNDTNVVHMRSTRLDFQLSAGRVRLCASLFRLWWLLSRYQGAEAYRKDAQHPERAIGYLRPMSGLQER